ncbi:MAG: hypothetical protein KatS3mg105_3772 [Gemmatales bacterium]|nr:MAG: hypothetical protein KatS3mg105_3772 [Gemmatales bacterium]
MPFYRKVGSVPRKRHIAHRHEPGYRGEGIYYEEVVSTGGFDHAYSICYHLRPPTRVKKVEPAGEVSVDIAQEPVLRHHHFKTAQLKPHGDPILGRVPLLVNADVAISRCVPAQRQTELYRNAVADEVLFVHQGKGILHTPFGQLPFKPCDYVVIPRCTTYRLEFEAAMQPNLLVIEASESITIPPHYRNRMVRSNSVHRITNGTSMDQKSCKPSTGRTRRRY